MMTPYEHLMAIRQAYDKATDRVCKKHSLKHRELDILMYLNDYPNQATATDIVKKQNLSKSHVSISLRALEERGFVSGEYKGSNRRTIYLRLNDSASEVIADGLQARCDFAESMVKDFSNDEKKELASYLSRVRKNLISLTK